MTDDDTTRPPPTPRPSPGVEPRRGPGRPPAKEPGTVLTAWVPTSTYDRLVQEANQRDTSLSSVVNDLLKLKLRR